MRAGVVWVAMAVASLCGAVPLRATSTLAYSFENQLTDGPDGFFGLGATVTQDTIGATHSTHSMKYAIGVGGFVGARTEDVVPAALNDPPGVTHVLFDLTITEAYTDTFADIGVTVFGHALNAMGGPQFGHQVQFADEVAVAGLAPGTYTNLQIALDLSVGPYRSGESFNAIFGPGQSDLTVASAFQFYISKNVLTPLTVYIDNVRLVSDLQSFTLGTGDISEPVPSSGTAGIRNVPIHVPVVGAIVDVDVGIRLNHTFVGDLGITLIHPDGTRVSLINRRGGGGDNLGSGAASCAGTPTIFDDEAITAISAGAAPFAGSFHPEESLDALDFKLAYGDWTLEIDDQALNDSGTLYCVSLDVITVPSPTQLTDVDGNGSASALTDGLLLVRWLFGLRGGPLISGVVGPGCTRCTAPQIEGYLNSLND